MYVYRAVPRPAPAVLPRHVNGSCGAHAESTDAPSGNLQLSRSILGNIICELQHFHSPQSSRVQSLYLHRVQLKSKYMMRTGYTIQKEQIQDKNFRLCLPIWVRVFNVRKIYMTKLFTMGRSKYRPPIVNSFVIYCSVLSKFCFVRPSIATSFLFPVTYASVHTIVCLHSSVGSRPNSCQGSYWNLFLLLTAFRICYVLIYITYCSILPMLTIAWLLMQSLCFYQISRSK
jgi:hypothetical protein